jgi:hypothetical protein
MSKKLTKDAVNERLLSDNRGITLVGGYTNANTKSLFRCDCGFEWLATPGNIMAGKGCPSCVGLERLTTEIVSKRLSEDGRGIEALGNVINGRSKIEFRCSAGHTWTAAVHKVLNANGCPHCSDKRLSKDIVNERLLSGGSGIVLIGDYTNNYTKTMFSGECGHIWSATTNNVLRGKGQCPICYPSGFKADQAATVYAFTRDGYLKVGITNNLKQRLRQHRKHGKLNLVYERHYPIGRDAQIFEREFKQQHGGSFVTKEECPDGYTETFPLHILEVLLK